MKADLTCIPCEVLEILDVLRDAGKEAYLVGGFVRDLILGKPVHDFDVTTSALPEETVSLFSVEGFRTVPTGIRHGTVTVIRRHIPVEVTTFRVDGTYSDGRHPDKVVFTQSLREDLARRDFTVNALAMDRDGNVFDYFGGLSDLKRGLLRAVGDPQKRFTEDALRIMRVFRFSAQLGFEIEEYTLRATALTRSGLDRIAGERIHAEWMRLLGNGKVSDTVGKMKESGVFSAVFPGVAITSEQVANLDKLPTSAVVRFGYLLSSSDDRVISDVLERLHFSVKESSGIRQTVSALRREFGGFSVGVARKFLGGISPDLQKDLCDALFALGKVGQAFACEAREAIEQKLPLCVGDLALHGDDLMKIGLRGKEIGEALDFLLSLVTVDPALNEKELLLKILQERRER